MDLDPGVLKQAVEQVLAEATAERRAMSLMSLRQCVDVHRRMEAFVGAITEAGFVRTVLGDGEAKVPPLPPLLASAVLFGMRVQRKLDKGYR